MITRNDSSPLCAPGELAGGVEALLRPGVQRVDVDPPEQLSYRPHRQDGGAQVAFQPAAERDDQPDRVQREHRQQLPALAASHGGHDEHADRPFDFADRFELLVGERQPGRRRDPPAAQVARVELVRVSEHPA